MDLLKTVLGGIAAATQGQAAPTASAAGGIDLAALAPVLLELLGGQGGAAGANGGLAGLVAQLTRGGLGDIVQSWIAQGQNLPVSGDQLGAALGSDVLANLGGRLGMDGTQLSQVLAQALPGLIDSLTPNGQLPSASASGPDLGGLLGQLLR